MPPGKMFTAWKWLFRSALPGEPGYAGQALKEKDNEHLMLFASIGLYCPGFCVGWLLAHRE